MALALGGCGSPYVGVSVPVGPGSVRVGASNGGVTAGASARVGPVGVGVGVNQRGQVTGSAGASTSTRVGNARVGVGVGTGTTVLYDPDWHQAQPPQQLRSADGTPVRSGGSGQSTTTGAPQWRDAAGHIVPTCKVEGGC